MIHRRDAENAEIKHRKNAAEWIMWIVLWPVAKLLSLGARRQKSLAVSPIEKLN